MKTESKNLGLLIDLLLEGQDESSEGSWQSFLRTRKEDIVLLGEDVLKTTAYVTHKLKCVLEELAEERAGELLDRLYEVGDWPLPEGWGEPLGSVLSREPEWWAFVETAHEVDHWSQLVADSLVNELVSAYQREEESRRHFWLAASVSLVVSGVAYARGKDDPRTAALHEELVGRAKDESLGRQVQASLFAFWILAFSAWPVGNREACYRWLTACPYLEELRRLQQSLDDRFFILENANRELGKMPEWQA